MCGRLDQRKMQWNLFTTHSHVCLCLSFILGLSDMNTYYHGYGYHVWFAYCLLQGVIETGSGGPVVGARCLCLGKTASFSCSYLTDCHLGVPKKIL